MKSFKEFESLEDINEDLIESIIDDYYGVIDEGLVDFAKLVAIWIKKKVRKGIKKVSNTIKKAFGSLSFGKSVATKLNFITNGKALNEAEEGTPDLKSRMGYYAEFCTAWQLALLLKSKNLKFKDKPNNSVKYLQTYKKNYAKNSLLAVEFPGVDKNKLASEMDRQEKSGVALASQLWEDIKKLEDLSMMEFQIEITGESAKFESKADLIFRCWKMDKKRAHDEIKASLKAYKGWSINVSNSTFVSWVIELMAPEIGEKHGKSGPIELKVADFIEKDKSLKKQMLAIKGIQSGSSWTEYTDDDGKKVKGVSANRMKNATSREDVKALLDSEGIYMEVRDLLIEVFKKRYKKDKAQINKNMLKMMGLDGKDFVYLAVQNQDKNKTMETMSSKTSKSFKELLDQLRDDLNIDFTYSATKVNTSIIFSSGTTEIFKSNFAFRDFDKVSQMLNFKRWKK